MRYLVLGSPEYKKYIEMELSKMENCSFLYIEWHGKKFMENPTTYFEELGGFIKTEHYEKILIAVYENRWLSRLLAFFHDLEVGSIYLLRCFTLDKLLPFVKEDNGFDDQRVDKVKLDADKPYFVHLEVHVVDQCNLNCKACNNFSPFVSKESCTDLVKYEKDIKNLSDKFYQIGRFFLLGGEPLLDAGRCCEMVKIYRKYFPVGELRILTNATLIMCMRQEFWDCIRKYDVIIHISLYPPVQEKIDEIKKKLEKEVVSYVVFREVKNFAKHWCLKNTEDDEYNNVRCNSSGCHYLREGRLYKCPDAKLMSNMSLALGGVSTENLETKEGVTLDSEISGWDIIRKLERPIDRCSYCNFKNLKLVKWERIDGIPDVNDWIIESSLEIENKKLRNEISEITEDHNQLIKQRDSLVKDLEKTNNSISMRVGLLITWIPRKLLMIINSVRKD